MRLMIVLLFVLFFAVSGNAQDGPRAHNHFADLMLGIGSGQTNLSTSYQISWKFGKNQRLRLGAGMRFNAFFASDKYFVTAPAKLVKGEAGLGAFFKKPIEENMDTVQFSSAKVYSLNFLVHAGYTFSDKFAAGFNIDVVGVSFGGTQSGTYLNGNAIDGNSAVPVSGAPTGFNLLLVGENDIGSLNSEFFVTYTLNSNWSLKAGIQHIFMEYTTTTKAQQLPEPNDRFRITPTVFCAGVVYRIY